MVRFTKTRVTEDVGNPGKFVAQYWDRNMELWFDIGDARDSWVEAEAHLVAHLASRLATELTTEPVRLHRLHIDEADDVYDGDTQVGILYQGRNNRFWVVGTERVDKAYPVGDADLIDDAGYVTTDEALAAFADPWFLGPGRSDSQEEAVQESPPGTHKATVKITWTEVVSYSQEVVIDVPDDYPGDVADLIEVDDHPDAEDMASLGQIPEDYTFPEGYRTGWLDRMDPRETESVDDRDISDVVVITSETISTDNVESGSTPDIPG